MAAAIVLIVFAASAAQAGRCPTRANNLDDFARCMVPLKGTIGTAAVYSSGQYDESHKKLMQAMAMGNVTPPQVMPVTVGTYPPIAYYSPYFRFGNAYMHGVVGMPATYYPYSAHPYYYGYR